MRIKSVRIQNFRSFEDEIIFLDNYNCFVGANGSGKSTVLSALNIFFRDTSHSAHEYTVLTKEDFHCKNTNNPIEITVTFDHLSDEAKEDLSHYVRQDELTVTAKAIYSAETQQAEVIQYGKRKGMVEFIPFFQAVKNGAKKDGLKTIYENIQTQGVSLPAPGTIQQMKDALNGYEAEHPNDCGLIESPDQFYGFTQGSKLAPYVLWAYVPAVKDASDEQVESRDTVLGKLLAFTVRSSIDFAEVLGSIKSQAQEQYRAMLVQHKQQLSSLSEKLMNRLQVWSHPNVRLNLDWKSDSDKALKVAEPLIESILGEGAFDGEVKRFGHGLQRSYILALLQELAELNTERSPTLILGCEEPELYQHPPQAQYLATVFRKLSEGNSQILLSTHAPYFVSGKDFEDVYYVRCNHATNSTTVTNVNHGEIASVVAAARGETVASKEGIVAKIHQALQPHINEMFFTPTLILVEGMEDIAYITTYLHLMGLWDEYRRYGCHMVHVDNKNNLFNPIAIAKKLGIPHFIVFDADKNIYEKAQQTTDASGRVDPDGIGEKHRKDNATLLNLCGADPSTPFPSAHCFGENYMMWATNIGDSIETDFDKDTYNRAKAQTHLAFGDEGGLKKNSLFIAELLTDLWNQEHKSANLQRLCEAIIRFARAVHTPPPSETEESELIIQQEQARASQASR